MRSDGVRMIVVLALISLLSAAVLATFHSSTAPAIARNKQLELQSAVLEVLPGAVEYTALQVAQPVTTGESEGADAASVVYQGLADSGKKAGVAFVAEGPGFQGIIKVMVGLDPESGTITGIKVLEQLETPGLGARIAEGWFAEQFQNKKITDPFEAKNDVEAVTGATISSRAVASIVKQGVERTMALLEGGEQ